VTKKIPKPRKGNDEYGIFDSLSRSDIHAELGETQDFMMNLSIEGAPKYVIGHGYRQTALAGRLEDFLKALERDTVVPFDLISTKCGRPVLKAHPLGKWYSTVMHSTVSNDEHHEFSEEVQLVLKGIRALKADARSLKNPEAREWPEGRYGYEIFNELVVELRRALTDEGFLARRRRRREQARRHYLSGKTYVDDLFERHSRLVVLRIDFGYRDWTNAENNMISNKALDQARRDLARFFNNRRSNTVFDHMVGHLWKLEEGTTKGYHFHVMFFFDGSKVQHDAHLAKLLGDYWQHKITKGEGCFYNCNAHKSKYRRLGIGRIEHGDHEMRDNLLLALAYMTKADQYLRVRADAARIFGKGVVRARLSAAGRPRRKPDASDTSAKVDNGQNLDNDSLLETI
jgi:hypothetical protein